MKRDKVCGGGDGKTKENVLLEVLSYSFWSPSHVPVEVDFILFLIRVFSSSFDATSMIVFSFQQKQKNCFCNLLWDCCPGIEDLSLFFFFFLLFNGILS